MENLCCGLVNATHSALEYSKYEINDYEKRDINKSQKNIYKLWDKLVE